MAVRRPPRREPGTAVVRAVRDELARGWTPGLTVLTGDDLFHLDAAQRALLERLAPAEGAALALTVFSGREVDVGEVIAAASSAGMFSRRRVVLVPEVAELRDEARPKGASRGALTAFASDPPAESFLLVRAPALDLRRPLHRELLEAGRVLAFERADPEREGPRIVAEIAGLAREAGLHLSEDATELLAEVSAGDLYRASAEIEKIRSWAGEASSRRLTASEVREVVAGGGAISGWEVANAVVARDTAAAFEAARKVVDAGEEPLRILGGIAWKARAMLRAKAMLEAGRKAGEVKSAVWAGVPGDDLIRGLSRYSIEELLAFPARLLEADRTLKSRGVDARGVLESLVADLTGAATPAARDVP